MKRTTNLIRLFALIFAGLILVSACNNQDSIVGVDQTTADKDALLKILDADEAIQSFEPNYNEEDAMNFLGKTNTLIYPVRVGQRMRPISRTLDVQFSGDTAYGKVTRTFEGVLFIAASYEPFTWGDSNVVDTIITKEFTTTITRNIVFTKIGNTDNPMHNWRISAISLPEGGTLTENIKINSVTVFLPDGDTLTITSPNDYYLTHEPGMHHGGMHMLPSLNWNQEVLVRVEIASAYADTDFVTLTYGAIRGGTHHRDKRKFELVSEEFDGTMYTKVYEQTWKTRQSHGWKHAIINAIPRQVVYDDATPVEESTWGIPYKVN